MNLVLTTIFTPSSDCFKGPWTSDTILTGTLTCTFPVLNLTSCYPPYTSTDGYTYSPGVCPLNFLVIPQTNLVDYGYTPRTASYIWGSNPTSTELQGRNPTTTALWGSNPTTTESWGINPTTILDSVCCPPGMVYDSTSCLSEVNTPTSIFVGTTLQPILSPFVVRLPPVTVLWESRDLPLFTPISAPILGSINNTTQPIFGLPFTPESAVTKTSPAITASSTSQVPTGKSKTSSLTIGTKVGIGVGVTIGALVLLVTFSTWFWGQRRRRLQRIKDGLPFSKPELSGQGVAKKTNELGPLGQIEEMEGGGVILMRDSTPRYELDGNWRGSELQSDSNLR